MTNISILISTCGGPQWEQLARERALPSTVGQEAEVVISHQPDGTVASSRNAAATKASSDWLLFLDADDELDPGFCEAMRAVITNDPRVLYTPSVCYAKRQTRPKPFIWPRMDFKVGNWCIIATVIHKSLFEEVGGFREYGMYEDYALWAMCDVAGASVVEVPEAVYVAHVADRRSRNRAPGPCERFYWHQRVGRDVWPDHFADLTAAEDETRCLATKHLRFL